jgi:hypothetical protein
MYNKPKLSSRRTVPLNYKTISNEKNILISVSLLWLISASLLALLPVYLPVVTCLLGMSCGCLRVMSAMQGGPNCTLEICSENSIGYLHLSPGSDSIVYICLSLCEINALSSRNKLFYCLLFTV